MANQTTISLKELIQNVESHLHASGYSDGTIKRYHYSWRVLLKRCLLKGFHQFSYESCLAIIKQEYHIPLTVKLKYNHVFHLRTVKVLDEFIKHGRIFKCHQKPGKQATSIFSEYLNRFVNDARASGLSERTVGSKTIQLTRFLNYINDKGIERLDELTAESVLSYVKSLTETGYARL